MPQPRPARLSTLAAGCLLVVIVFAIFGAVTSHGFFSWDDSIHVTRNPYLNPPSQEHLREIWTNPYRKLYIPLSYTFFSAEAQISKWWNPTAPSPFHPAVFHIGSVLLHGLCTILVFQLLSRLVGGLGPSFAGAMFFAIHPLQVESVAWISETRGLLSALFSLVAVWLYVAYAGPCTTTRIGEPQADAPKTSSARRFTYYGLATAAYLLALLSKPSAAALPIIVALIDVGLCNRRWQSVAESLAPWAALAIVFIVITKQQQLDSVLTYVPPLWARPFVALDALAFYLGKLVLPANLAVHYDHQPQTVLKDGWAYLTWIIPCLVLGLLWRSRRSGPWLVAAGIFVAALLPTLGLIPFQFQVFSTVADRYAYMAMLGPALAMAAWLARSTATWRGTAAAWALILCGWLSLMQVSRWSDNQTLYEHTLTVNPRSWMAHNHLGLALKNDGRLGVAMRHFRQAIEMDPSYADAHYNLGNTLVQAKDLQQASEHYTAAIRLNPRHYLAHFRLANVLKRQGELDKAAGHYQAVLKINPDHVQARMSLALILDHSEGRAEDAIHHYRKILRLQPKANAARYNLAWLLATNPNSALRDPTEAVFLAEGATQLPARERALGLDTLAAAYAAAGRYQEAVEAASEAIRAAESIGQNERAVEIRRRQALYRARQAYVDQPAGK